MTDTIYIDLYSEERDFIVDLLEYILFPETLKKFKNAKIKKDGTVRILIDKWDLDDIIGNLSLEANHNKKRSVGDTADYIAEKLETYQ